MTSDNLYNDFNLMWETQYLLNIICELFWMKISHLKYKDFFNKKWTVWDKA